MSDSETNLLKFELGISNDLVSLLYLPLVSSSDAMAMKGHFSIINPAVWHILLTFEKKHYYYELNGMLYSDVNI
jgi:hypothetical protein